jgi:DNA-directed RNA polymerase specialized sigma24 family protein
VIEHKLRTGFIMSSTDRGIVLHRLDRLFTEGTLAGIGDGELLDRFRSRRDEAAFEALVELHGPMVLGLCRRFLRDPRDIEDAFQATFLVLVQKAPSIRNAGLLSSWLYGVALRVATRARANLLRRRGREQALGEADFAAKPESDDILGLGPLFDRELPTMAMHRAC